MYIAIDPEILAVAAQDLFTKAQGYSLARAVLELGSAEGCATEAIEDVFADVSDWYRAHAARVEEGLVGVGQGAEDAAAAYAETNNIAVAAFEPVVLSPRDDPTLRNIPGTTRMVS